MDYYFEVTRLAAILFLPVLLSIGHLNAQVQQRPKAKQRSAKAAIEMPASYRAHLTASAQAIVVATADWNSVDGTMTRFEKKDGKWQPVGAPVAVVVGKNGVAWDGAIDAKWSANEPVKKEGDGRSPAGIFQLTQAFGYDPTPPVTKLPYLPLTEATECVDDASSNAYSQIVNREQIPHPDWNSSEKMRSVDVYRIGLVVDYNSDALAGAGSCIFMHIWNGPGKGTAGCTAMEEARLKELVNWLNAEQHPVLIQMPETVYRALRNAWQLP
jgi:zinc D-Ala-D-Ala dipeptidase